jgi:hypothetical protein
MIMIHTPLQELIAQNISLYHPQTYPPTKVDKSPKDANNSSHNTKNNNEKRDNEGTIKTRKGWMG